MLSLAQWEATSTAGEQQKCSLNVLCGASENQKINGDE
jgi:hypothetical protein